MGRPRRAALPAPADAYPLAAAGALALAFLLPGLLRANAAMHLAGLGMLAVGTALQWDGYPAIAALALLALFASATTRSGPLAENRWTGFALAALASWELARAEGSVRDPADPALVGRWAQTLYLVLASTVAVAGPLWKSTQERWEAPGGFHLRLMSWLLAAGLALGGGTVEIPAFVLEHGGSDLAARLSVSAFWLAAAGGLLAYGFWKDVRSVRITGLTVAALAILKVVLSDLTELRALYRVGSLALLAVITLLAARAYHRREGTAEVGGGGTEGPDGV